MDKPHGVTLPPTRFQLNADEADEMGEVLRLQRDLEGISALRNSQRDQIGELLKATYYKQHAVFHELQYRGYSSSVTRYYPQRNVALDIFESIGPEERHEIAFKQDGFKKIGVRYAFLSFSSDLSELLAQIGVK